MTEVRLLRLPDVSHMTGLGKSTIRMLVDRNEFPEPTRLTSPSVTVWRSDDIQDWIKTTSRRAANVALGEVVQSGQRNTEAS